MLIGVELGSDGVPVALTMGDRRLIVVEQIDCWPGEDHLYRRVRVASGAIFTIRYDAPDDRWELHSFEAP
jgi:hypothetical protein